MKNVQGYTLIELIVVIIIIGFVSAQLIVRLPSFSTYNLDSQAYSILKDIQLTRILALSYNKTYRITFSSTSYQIQDSNGSSFTFPDTASTTITLPSGLTFNPSSNTLYFNNLGQPVNASNTVLSAVSNVTLTDGSTSKSISIQPQTGFSQ